MIVLNLHIKIYKMASKLYKHTKIKKISVFRLHKEYHITMSHTKRLKTMHSFNNEIRRTCPL